MFESPKTLFGLRIIERKPRAKIRLSNDFEWCSHKFRSEFNQWLLETFGEDDDRIYIMPSMGVAVMTPYQFAAIDCSMP